MALAGRTLPYVLRRSSRRTFALQLDHRGVRVAVPHEAREADVARFIAEHSAWLIDKLAARQRSSVPSFEPSDGAIFPLFGADCRLRIAGTGRSARWRLASDGLEELVVADAGDIRAAIVRALRRRALPWFAARVAEYCFRLGRPVPPVRLSSARTRWGSCSASSGIRLHWRLIHLPVGLIDYVVAHEVAHLVEMNHSARFWAVTERLFPEWKAARARLRTAGRALPAIDSASMGETLDED